MQTQTQTILAQVAADFDFTVDKFPLSGPDNIRTPLYGLFRSDDMGLVGSSSVTSRYVPHTTDDVLALVEATQDTFQGCTVKTHFRDGHYVTVCPSDSERRQLAKSEGIFPRLFIRAGFDGKAFKVSLGLFRDLCSNLVMLRSVNSCHWSVTHNGSLRDKMDRMREQFTNMPVGWENLNEKVEQMRQAPVVLEDFLNRIYPAPEVAEGRGVTIHENRTRKIFNRIMRERAIQGLPQFTAGNYEVSAWEAYNAVQGYVQHDATRKGGATEYDRVILASNDAAVREAEVLAMAAIAA